MPHISDLSYTQQRRDQHYAALIGTCPPIVSMNLILKIGGSGGMRDYNAAKMDVYIETHVR